MKEITARFSSKLQRPLQVPSQAPYMPEAISLLCQDWAPSKQTIHGGISNRHHDLPEGQLDWQTALLYFTESGELQDKIHLLRTVLLARCSWEVPWCPCLVPTLSYHLYPGLGLAPQDFPVRDTPEIGLRDINFLTPWQILGSQCSPKRKWGLRSKDLTLCFCLLFQIKLFPYETHTLQSKY